MSKTSPSPALTPVSQGKLKRFFQLGLQQGCPKDQLLNFSNASIVLQARQLAASAAARLCDQPDGPKAVGYGGARGGGKTHWLLSQIGADDCQRVPGLRCLLLRKIGKSNLEHFEDLRRRLFIRLPHEFNASRGFLVFPNDSRITLGHYQFEKDIDAYLGREFDVIGIEEATQLTLRKYEDISTCCRTSKTNWRPRLYSTTNPGGLGHQWYLEKFIVPHQCGTESATRFIPARVEDNAFLNPDYKSNMASRTGWQYDAWYLGRWDFPAGQYFRNFQPDVHVIGEAQPGTGGTDSTRSTFASSGGCGETSPSPPSGERAGVSGPLGCLDPDSLPPERRQFLEELARLRRFRESDAVEWVASMDYGYTHRTVALLGCLDAEDNLYIVDEHAERYWIPQRHAQAIKAMFARHDIYASEDHLKESILARYAPYSYEAKCLWRTRQKRMLSRFVAGSDMFGSESHGESVAKQYRELGLSLRAANMDRASGWSAILQRLGDPAAGFRPSLFIHQRCRRLLECLPYLQHDPDRPGDVLKTNINDDGVGGDDAADALRYLVTTKVPKVCMCRLRGL